MGTRERTLEKKGLRNTGLDKSHTRCSCFFFGLSTPISIIYSSRFLINCRIITFSWVRRVRNVIQGRIYRRLNLGAQCFYESWLSTLRRMASFMCQHTLWLRLNGLFLNLKLLLFPPTRKKKRFQPPTSPLGQSRLPCVPSPRWHIRDGCPPCYHRGQIGCTEHAASALFWWHVCAPLPDKLSSYLHSSHAVTWHFCNQSMTRFLHGLESQLLITPLRQLCKYFIRHPGSTNQIQTSTHIITCAHFMVTSIC